MVRLRSPRLGQLPLTLAPMLTLASGSPVRPPAMPTFSASVSGHALALAQFPGYSANPYFHGITLAFDSETGSSMIQVLYKTFAYLGADFEHLMSKQVSVSDGTSTTLARNGSECYSGDLANLRALDVLWPQLQQHATYVALGEVSGQSCDTWRVRNASVGNLSACIRSDGVPLSILAEPDRDFVGLSNVFSYSLNWTLRGIRVGNGVKIEPITCPTYVPKACAGKGKDSFQVMRATSGEPWGTLADRDTFDWPGMAVTLGAPGYESFINQKYLKVLDVEADTAFGPWRDCNYNHAQKRYDCESLPEALARLVSRSSAEQLTHSRTSSRGQCDANELVGSWLVFPSQGECGAHQSVGEGNCTWKNKGARKVVEMECVRSFDSNGWARAWQEDYQKPPFPNVLRAVKAAVEGCPDIRRPLLSSVCSQVASLWPR